MEGTRSPPSVVEPTKDAALIQRLCESSWLLGYVELSDITETWVRGGLYHDALPFECLIKSSVAIARVTSPPSSSPPLSPSLALSVV